MPTECSAKTFELARGESRAVVAAFDGGTVTSDAESLLLGRRIGRTSRWIGLGSNQKGKS